MADEHAPGNDAPARRVAGRRRRDRARRPADARRGAAGLPVRDAGAQAPPGLAGDDRRQPRPAWPTATSISTASTTPRSRSTPSPTPPTAAGASPPPWSGRPSRTVAADGGTSLLGLDARRGGRGAVPAARPVPPTGRPLQPGAGRRHRPRPAAAVDRRRPRPRRRLPPGGLGGHVPRRVGRAARRRAGGDGRRAARRPRLGPAAPHGRPGARPPPRCGPRGLRRGHHRWRWHPTDRPPGPAS